MSELRDLAGRASLHVLPTEPRRASMYAANLEAIRSSLLDLDRAAVADLFRLSVDAALLKTTISLCPDCLRQVPAAVYARAGRVEISKTCPQHGPSRALLESDEAFYHLSNRDRWGVRYSSARPLDFPEYAGNGCCDSGACEPAPAAPVVTEQDFADQMSNKTCTVLVEVTNACNLACPVCYADAKGDRWMPFDEFKHYMLDLIAAKGGLDSVQLTGGEATIHPEFWSMVEFLHQDGRVNKIYLPTNGIALADPSVAQRLVPFKSRVMVLLQFDGSEQSTNEALRGARLDRIRERCLENLGRLDIQTQLTMTVSRGINDREIGWVIAMGLRHNHVKVVALQPATYSGRYDLEPDPMSRSTLSDVVKGVVSQVRARLNHRDFVPIPCSHPNCGWITLFVRRFGIVANIARHVDLERAMDRVANRTLLASEELRGVVGTRPGGLVTKVATSIGRRLIRSKDVFAVAIKPFMDRYSYDQDRISSCCHHLMDTHGRPVSFCEYNARLRPLDSWDRRPTTLGR